MQSVFLALFILVNTIWWLLCLPLALFGLLLPRSNEKVIVAEVERKVTICRLLFEKSLLSEQEYSFETHQVAPYYNKLTFRGYCLIVAPCLWALKNFSFLDSLAHFLVKQWMKVHHRLLQQNTIEKTGFKILLTRICTNLAYGTGRSLSLLSFD